MKIRTLDELGGTVEPICQMLTPWGLATGGRVLSPAAALEYHQQTIDVELASEMPDSIRKSFEQLQDTHVMGILNANLFSVADRFADLVMEQGFGEKFIDYYDKKIPLIREKDGNLEEACLEAHHFRMYYEDLNKPGGKHRGGWKVRSRRPNQQPIRVSGNFRSLLDWARYEGITQGQRFRRMEDFLIDFRNHSAHPVQYNRCGPDDSALSIQQVAEILNRLWGMWTPGGRIFPAPMERRIMFPCWDSSTQTISVTRAEQMEMFKPDRQGWQFLAVLGYEHDQSLWYFDADFEVSSLPSDLLWGPGSWDEAVTWLASAQVVPDVVEHTDRLFALRLDGQHVDLPRNLNQLAGLVREARKGKWLLCKADFPGDAFGHARAIASGLNGHPKTGFCRACGVDVEDVGPWAKVLKGAERRGIPIEPRAPCGIRVDQDRFGWFL